MNTRGCLSLLSLLVIASPSFSRAEAIEPPPSIQLDGVPSIPVEVARRVEPYLEYRTARFQAWDPKGGMLVLTRFGDTPQLHRVAMPGGARTQISFRNEPVSAATYVRAAQPILLAGHDAAGAENFQFYRVDGATWTLLTDGRSRNTDLVVDHARRRIGYTSTARNGRDADLWIIDPADPASARMVAEREGPGWRFFDFSASSNEALVQRYITDTRSELYLLDLKSGQFRSLSSSVRGDAPFAAAKFGPGDAIYATTDVEADFLRLVEIDRKTGAVRPLLPPQEGDVESFDVGEQPHPFIAYSINQGGASRVFILDLRSKEVRAVRDLPDGVIDRLEIGPDGQIGLSLTSARSPGDAWSIDLVSLEVTRWTMSEAGGIDTDRLPLPQQVSIKSFDGLPISGFLYRPDPAKFTGPRPLLMIVHGGPAAQSRPIFQGRSNYYLNELGIAVFEPNVRGSEGFGKRFLELDDGLRREDSLRDIGAFLEHLARDPGIDASRIALSGGSYSGYLVLRAMSDYPNRVKAGIVQSGITDFVTFLENTEAYRRDLRRAEYGDERDPAIREFLRSISPMSHADAIRQPLLVISGANDPRVKLSESNQIVEAVRRNGGPVWHMIALNEGHGYRRKENRDFQLMVMGAFLSQYLLDSAPSKRTADPG